MFVPRLVASFFTYGSLLILAVIFSVPQIVSAASLAVTPAAGTHVVGSTFTTTVFAASDAPALNAVSGDISFPANLLEVVSLSKNQSIVSHWVKEPVFSNTAGTIQFEGVVLNPGYTGTAGRVLTVTFRVKNTGSADVAFITGSILANDGEGTEILKNRSTATYVLRPAETVIPKPSTPETPSSDAGVSQLPQVISETHPAGMWSALTDGSFSFALTPEIVALRLLVDAASTTVPTKTYVPPITTRTITGLDEGVSYLHVQYKTAAGWGEVLHYKLQIDTKAPAAFTVTEVTPGTFSVVAIDELSGIARYDMILDGGAAIPFTDDGSHTFTVPTMSPGVHTLLVRAFDAAGNTTDSSATFTVAAPPVAIATPAPVVSDSPLISNGTFAIAILSVVTPLVALILLLGWLLHVAWRALGGMQRKIAREVAEAEAIVHQVFVTMRTDFEVDIETLRKASVKRKLTREESKILKHLQRNLDQAEASINKEMDDIEVSTRL